PSKASTWPSKRATSSPCCPRPTPWATHPSGGAAARAMVAWATCRARTSRPSSGASKRRSRRAVRGSARRAAERRRWYRVARTARRGAGRTRSPRGRRRPSRPRWANRHSCRARRAIWASTASRRGSSTR
ncbi:hypothetical protein LTR39_004694, partial [Cryomyces antarcticus]